MGIIDYPSVKSDAPSSRLLIAGSVLLSGLSLAGCVVHPKATISDLSSALGPGWTMAPLPNSALLPGAVVEVTTANGGSITNTSPIQIRWLGSLQDCGVPTDALAVNTASVPGIVSGDTFSLNASIAAKAVGVSLGSLGVNGSDSAHLTINTSSDDSLDYLHFSNWLDDPSNHAAVDKACGSQLTQSNIFIVQEAFVISSGSYNFVDGGGGTISVAPPNSPVTGSANVAVGNGGTITIGAPTVFALKALQEVPSGAFHVASITPQELTDEVRINDQALTPRIVEHETLADRYAAAIPLLTQPRVLVSPELDLGGTSITDISGLPPPK
jgi:hypothetical protein